MKIVVINGSPKGSNGSTNVMVKAFLKGARMVGADALNIFLTEKQIQHCKGCHTCWTRGPGQCVIGDDMLQILPLMGGANIIVFASPVYFGNISGMLKVFMDRMTMIGGPSQQENTSKDKTPPAASAVQIPKLMMISSCGLPDRTEFDVTSLWMNRVAQKMQMELAGEIYAAQAKFLLNPPEGMQPAISDYLSLLEQAGKEIAADQSLSAETKAALEQARAGFKN